VERISPEAPVPVVALDRKEQRIGGAGNVALNLASLHAQVSIISVMGNDDDGIALKHLFDKQKIDTSYLLQSSHRITTNKSRIISRNQQMMRLDAEITKDLKEVKEGLNIIFEEVNQDTLNEVHQKLQEHLQHHISFITLSEKGVFYQDDNSSRIIPSHLRNIADVSGAGDTVIAVASLIYAATGSVELMAEVANIAGGLVCEEVGTAAINRDRLLQECRILLN